MNKNDPILGGVIRGMAATVMLDELLRDEAIEARAEQRRAAKEYRTWDEVAEAEREQGAAP